MKSLEKLDLTHKKVIAFDLDGTLIDSIGIWNQTDCEMIRHFAGLDIPMDVVQKERDAFLETQHGSDIYLEYCGYLIDKYQLLLKKEQLLTYRWKYSESFLRNRVDYKEKADVFLHKLK